MTPPAPSTLMTRAAIRAIEDTGDFDPVHDQEGAAERFAAAFLAAQDRDMLAGYLAEAWCAEGQHIGDLSERDWARWYRVVDALLGGSGDDDRA